jgi:uncharacterized membrane protein
MSPHVTTSFQVGFGVPGGDATALVLAALLLAALVLGLRSRAARRWQRSVLGLLRVLSALLAFALASQPTFWTERARVDPGRLAVLVDVSRSMGVRTSEARMERARKLLARWTKGESAHKASFFLLGEELAPAQAGELAAALSPKAAATRLLPALSELAKEQEFGAVVVVSDGADTSGAGLPKQLETRVHTVLVPDGRKLRDDTIARVDADAVAFLHGEAKVHATLESHGLGDRELTVLLKRGERVLAHKLVELTEDKPVQVELGFSPLDLGREAYTLELAVDPRDDVPQNNSRAFLVRVTRDRLRVLHVSGRPSWDQRFLRGFLKRDPSIDLVSFFILRSVHDLTMSSPSELALIPFPTDELFRQHLTSFDVVLLQDFDYGPYQMSAYLPLLRDYVRGGGGMAMIGGSLSFDGGGYPETALAEALPVRMKPSDPRGAAIVAGDFSPEPIHKYLHHPLLELYPEPAQTTAAFRALAPLSGLNELLGVREGALTLLEHPSAKNERGEKLPVLAVGRFGRGRTLAFATDSSWHWSMPTAGKGGDSSVYDRFWDRAVRFLTRDPLLDPAHVTSDREAYTPNARMLISALARDESYRPLARAGLRLELQSASGALQSHAEVSADQAGQVRATMQAPDQPGVYRMLLRAGEQVLAQAPFLVELAGVELARPSPDPALLKQLAQRSGGRFFDEPESAPDLERLDSSRTTSLGSERHAPFGQPLWVVLAVAFMMFEWWLRRRWGER